MIVIGRPINGISINGYEYLLNDNGHLKKFDDVPAAKKELLEAGEVEDNLWSYSFIDAKTYKVLE